MIVDVRVDVAARADGMATVAEPLAGQKGFRARPVRLPSVALEPGVAKRFAMPENTRCFIINVRENAKIDDQGTAGAA